MAGRRYRATLIGNANFPRDAHALPALHGPLIDIEELRLVLTDREVGLFHPDDIVSLPDSGVHQAREHLDGFFSNAVRDDVLLLYYSGHGQLDERGALYLCAGDTLVDSLRATALSAQEINNMIESSAAEAIIIVLDCCHSGAFKTAEDLAASVAGKGRYVLASNRSTQLARAAAAPGRPSPFTATLVRGLRHAEAQGHLTVAELYRQVHHWITEHTPLVPQLRFAGEGEVIIARRPNVSPGTLPRPQRPLDPAPGPHTPRARPLPKPPAPVAEQETVRQTRSIHDTTTIRYRLYDPVWHRRVTISTTVAGLAFLALSLVTAQLGHKADGAMLVGTAALGSLSLKYHKWLFERPLMLLITDGALCVRQGGRTRDYEWDEISKIEKIGMSSDKRATFKLYDSSGELVENMLLPVIAREQWRDFATAVHDVAPHVTVQDRVNSR